MEKEGSDGRQIHVQRVKGVLFTGVSEPEEEHWLAGFVSRLSARILASFHGFHRKLFTPVTLFYPLSRGS